MFTGRKTTYTPKANEHTMIINIDKQAGSFTCLVWDGFQAEYSKGANKALVGTFAKNQKRIQVLVYGGTLPKTVITGLLSAWIGGKWVKMTLNELSGGATIPKHTL